jgi:hypothetical protein
LWKLFYEEKITFFNNIIRKGLGKTMTQETISFPASGNEDVVLKKIMSETEKIKNGICPCCEGNLVFQEGCKMCYSCGWGGCS